MNLVTIVITTHKGSNCVAKAIESVVSQEYQNIEIIVVDDNGVGSPEQNKTEEILKKYIDANKISYIRHPNNSNGAVARNTGFKHSKGDYIGFLDDDDTYLPGKVKKQVEEMQQLDESWGLTYCSAKIKNSDGSIKIRKANKSGDLLFELLLHKVVIGTDSMLIRRAAFERLNGFDETFLRHQDYEFTARAADMFNIKAVDFVGFEYNRGKSRNSPKSLVLAQNYRRHYIDKMESLIQKFEKNKQYQIIYSNSLEVTSSYLKKGDFLLFREEFISYTNRWLKQYRPLMLLNVMLIKGFQRINRII